MYRVIMLSGLCMLLFAIVNLAATPVGESTARTVAHHQLSRINAQQQIHIDKCEYIQKDNQTLGYVFILQPAGYIVVAADDRVSPVLAYSTDSEFGKNLSDINVLAEILTADLSNRMQYAEIMPPAELQQRRQEWQNLRQGLSRPPLDQWPPAGTTATGGWVKTRWNQNGPYNAMCPLDVANGGRSYAGCPAVAMGQIVNYWGTINGTVFTDADDYHHNYSGNNYWIDNDSTTFGFPSFPRLNGYLDTAMHHYRYQEEITNQDKAAVIFGCAVAATQVFGSAGSGTFGVSQAMEAYQRFNFPGAALLGPGAVNTTSRMIQNMMDARPVHYAIVTPANDSGHNVVVDGYNTDGFFHVNFGWGGQYDGWYLLPSELPYNLTVLEGAIVDIQPYQYTGVFPLSVDILTLDDALMPHEILLWNNSPLGAITLEAYDFDTMFANVPWVVNGLDLPLTLAYGENVAFNLQVLVPLLPRDTLETNFRIIFDKGVVNIPIRWNEAVQDAGENIIPVNSDIVLKQNHPNPFRNDTALDFTLAKNGNVSLCIYNLKGQLVRSLSRGSFKQGNHTIDWDGKDAGGKCCTPGVYLYKLKNGTSESTKKMLLIK